MLFYSVASCLLETAQNVVQIHLVSPNLAILLAGLCFGVLVLGTHTKTNLHVLNSGGCK